MPLKQTKKPGYNLSRLDSGSSTYFIEDLIDITRRDLFWTLSNIRRKEKASVIEISSELNTKSKTESFQLLTFRLAIKSLVNAAVNTEIEWLTRLLIQAENVISNLTDVQVDFIDFWVELVREINLI
jgi:aspartyl/asparaginyl-tRNA synthetase